MPIQGDKQPRLSVLEKLQPLGHSIEQAIEQLDLTEEYFVLRFCGFELHKVRRVAHSRRRCWGRWVTLFGVLAALIAGVIKFWLIN